MLPETVKLLSSFRGKVCTIFTTPVNHPFDANQMREYFVGIVDAVNKDGILLKHHVTGGRTFISMSKFAAIAEEQALDPSDPKHREFIEAMKKKEAPPPAQAAEPPAPKPQPKRDVAVPKGQFVNADVLSQLSHLGKKIAGNP